MRKTLPSLLVALAFSATAFAEPKPAPATEKPKAKAEAPAAKPAPTAKKKEQTKKKEQPKPAPKAKTEKKPEKAAAKPEAHCDLKQEIGAIEKEIAGLSQTLDHKKAEIERSHQRHHDEIDALTKKLAASQKSLAECKKDGEAKAKAIAELEKSNTAKSEAAKAAKAASAAAMAALTKKFDNARTESTKALAAAGDKGKQDTAKIKSLEAQIAAMKKQCHQAHVALEQLRKNVAELGKVVSDTEIEGLPKKK